MQLDARMLNADRVSALVRHRLSAVFELFDNPEVTEVSINCGDEIWITKAGRRERAPQVRLTEVDISSAIRELAGAMGQDARPETPSAIVHAKLPGLRFAGVLGPTAGKGSALSIRKHAKKVFTLDQYVAAGSIPAAAGQQLRQWVREGKNMLVCGSTDTGKTTLLNALSREIPGDERVLTIEEPRELQLVTPNWIPLEANVQKALTPTLLVELCVRKSPDRILLGELKGPEAAAFLEAANTGHHGCMASLHCNSAYDALARLEVLTLRAGLDWPLAAIRQQIASTIHVIVHMGKADGMRRLNEVALVRGYDAVTSRYDVEWIYRRADGAASGQQGERASHEQH